MNSPGSEPALVELMKDDGADWKVVCWMLILHFQCLPLSPFTHPFKCQLFHWEKHPTPLTYSEPTRTFFPFWLIFILWSLEDCIQLPTKCSEISLGFLWLFLSYCKYFYDNRSGRFWCAAVNFPNESPLLHLCHVSLSSKALRDDTKPGHLCLCPLCTDGNDFLECESWKIWGTWNVETHSIMKYLLILHPDFAAETSLSVTPACAACETSLIVCYYCLNSSFCVVEESFLGKE